MKVKECETCGLDFESIGTHPHIYENEDGEEILLIHDENSPKGRQPLEDELI